MTNMVVLAERKIIQVSKMMLQVKVYHHQLRFGVQQCHSFAIWVLSTEPHSGDSRGILGVTLAALTFIFEFPSLVELDLVCSNKY
jgi:hypothetical protein